LPLLRRVNWQVWSVMRPVTRILFLLPHDGLGAHGAPARSGAGRRGPRKRRAAAWGRAPRWFVLAIGGVVFVTQTPLAQRPRQGGYESGLYSGLHWRLLGPFRGGRVDTVSGVPGRRNEFYFGSVNGGVWKSVDAGRVWLPIFDSQPVASIGSLAVAPSAPDIVYVGTGESTLRDSTGYGNGVYKSTDAGRTWTHLGLDETHHIGKVAIDPKNPNVVFVAAIGHLYDANPDRGVFRTQDGGRTWRKVLFKNDNVGAVDVVIDPVNPRIVYAALWNTRRPPWYTYQPTNGPGGGIFKSTDGGTTWTQLTKGLPANCIGRSGIAVAPSNPRRVYAIVDNLLPESPASPAGRGSGGQSMPPPDPCPATPPGRGGGTGRGVAPAPLQGGLYRSDDAGDSWVKMSTDGASIAGLAGRGWYFEKIVVDPQNADLVYVPNVGMYRSSDGGRTWVTLRGSPGGDDYHQAWISPDDPDTMIVASDQGAIITRNARSRDPKDVTWSSWLNQPTAQIYHVSTDYRFPYWVTGAQQDSGAVAVRTRGKFAGISMRDWEPIGPGGESGMTAGDPLHPGIVFGGSGARWDLEMNAAVGTVSAPQGPEPARTDWTQPLVFSTANPHALYYANQFLFKTTDDAQTWIRIGDDLTRPDPGVPPTLDEVSARDTDRNGRRGVIYTIAPSPLQAALLWIGTDDGYIQVTPDEGKTWENVTPPGLTAWSRVTMMEASHFDANEAYASVDRHQLSDFNPHIYRTRDRGRTWQEVTRGLPKGVYVHTIKEDPGRRGLLFAGTERNAFLSFDDGDTWQSLQLNLPVTSVRDFEIHGDDLIVATHGRGFWIIDDISPLRQITDDVANADAFLFKPAEAILMTQGSDNGTPTQKDEPQAPNPPAGAAIDYYLRRAATGPVTLEILDAAGNAIGRFSNVASSGPGGGAGRGDADQQQPESATGGFPPSVTSLWRTSPDVFAVTAGMHRVVWNPAPAGGRGGFGRGGRGSGRGAAGPGSYTVRLTADGKTYTQPLVVKPDPRTKQE
jgi:photosystem II stability/assembly factor-like uncharacterized protein